MKRAFTAVAAAAVLMSMLPGAAFAGAATKFTDHDVAAFCGDAFDGGFWDGSLDSSALNGESAGFELWLDPAIAFEDPQTALGFVDSVDVTVGASDVLFSATVPANDFDGNPLGDATLVATMAFDGPVQILGGQDFGNHHSRVQGTFQHLVGTGTLTLGGIGYTVTCDGGITDVTEFDTNPTSFIFDNAGVIIDCFWETADGLAAMFATDDIFGFAADAYLLGSGVELGSIGQWSGSIDAGGFSLDIGLQDLFSGDPASASASADFTPIGDPVTSVLIQDTGHVKEIDQALDPSGTLTFSTGDTFPITGDHCNAKQFAVHAIHTQPSGPKPGAVPPNDTIAGAIALKVGSRLNAQTVGTANDPEIQVSTCPQGFGDAFGHTLWYTVQGTGGPITVDTAGSNMDTVVAVFVADGVGGLAEVACNDDVDFDPIGSTFQAAVTLDTEAGVTYWIEAGGFMNPFVGIAESGRLRLRIN